MIIDNDEIKKKIASKYGHIPMVIQYNILYLFYGLHFIFNDDDFTILPVTTKL